MEGFVASRHKKMIVKESGSWRNEKQFQSTVLRAASADEEHYITLGLPLPR